MQSESSTPVRTLCDQAASLAHIHDSITRVVGNISIPEDDFTDQYGSRNRPDFTFDTVVRLFIYQHARELNQSMLADRLQKWPYVRLRLNLNRAPTQQTLSYTWRNRLSRRDRQQVKEAASHIRTICAYHGLIKDYESALNPDDFDDQKDLKEEQIMEAFRRASATVFNEFDTKRAENAKYPDSVFFERQGYLNMEGISTSTLRRRFNRLSDRDEVPAGETHLRTMKKAASPDPQTQLDAFCRGAPPPSESFSTAFTL